ncbi:GGDEF domain-containing protein [Singulisphaera sp. PoT]|uniref:GGDEF domain-containing protein n=1 Tax=Singulisphaera sp. PoT TaxID=3411797 RepID=UPI003BF4FE25
MKILVAEDQEPSGLALRKTLENLGHEAVVVASGAEAWERIVAEDWRMVITDWMMPHLDGPELCRRIRNREDAPYVYIILLTGRDGRNDRLQGLAAGADDFLTKPVDRDELSVRLAIARRILGVQAELEEKNARLAELVTTDPLTGLANRRRLREVLQTTTLLSGRKSQPCSVVILDIDHFKSINDNFGHAAGDATLKSIAEILKVETRRSDLPVRYGGEEFVILMPATDEDEAFTVAERLRETISVKTQPSQPVTASFGIATCALAQGLGIDALLDAADQALYRSKERGRNCVTHFRELSQV